MKGAHFQNSRHKAGKIEKHGSRKAFGNVENYKKENRANRCDKLK
jgi:hypothetical protein